MHEGTWTLGQDFTDDAKQDIRLEGSLVRLIEHNYTVLAEQTVR